MARSVCASLLMWAIKASAPLQQGGDHAWDCWGTTRNRPSGTCCARPGAPPARQTLVDQHKRWRLGFLVCSQGQPSAAAIRCSWTRRGSDIPLFALVRAAYMRPNAGVVHPLDPVIVLFVHDPLVDTTRNFDGVAGPVRHLGRGHQRSSVR